MFLYFFTKTRQYLVFPGMLKSRGRLPPLEDIQIQFKFFRTLCFLLRPTWTLLWKNTSVNSSWSGETTSCNYQVLFPPKRIVDFLLIWQCPGGNKILHNTDEKSQITACSTLEEWHGDSDDSRIGEHCGKEKSSMNSETMLLFPETCCALWRGRKSRISKLWNTEFLFLGSRFSFIKSWLLKQSEKKSELFSPAQKNILIPIVPWSHELFFSRMIISIE